MKRLAGAALLMMAAGCTQSSTPERDSNPTPPDLESAAISAGLIVDPKASDIGGLFARDTDRICIAPAALDYRIGVFIDYGDAQYCSGAGKVTRAGETLQIAFEGAPGCSFAARYEGDRIVFPGSIPASCDRLCTRRASLGGLDVRRLSDSAAEARTLRGARGRLLCAP